MQLKIWEIFLEKKKKLKHLKAEYLDRGIKSLFEFEENNESN